MAVPDADPQPAVRDGGDPEGGGAGGVPVGVADQLGRQQFDGVEDFVSAVPVQHGPYGHACDACRAGIMRQPKGVHPGVGQGYGAHEDLR
ncbi:hypothetical protein GCM10010300_07170 [Streptomyces olivaceoviridis]|nr:hypothetical protein GCM10010300_07170 [Streptomyces olivaceoviridis]